MTEHLNLLPDAYGRFHILRRRLIQWGVVWGLLVVVAIGSGWNQLRGYRLNSERLEGLERSAAPLIEKREKTAEMRKRLKDLQDREDLVLSLAEERSLLTLLGIIGDAAKHAAGEVSVSSMMITQAERGSAAKPTGKDSSAKPNAAHTGSSLIVLDGTGTNDIAIAQFVDSLRKSGVFHEVHLKSTAPKLINGQQARNYHLTCSY